MNTDDSEVWRTTVPSADRKRLASLSREGARIVGLDVVDGAAVLRLERRPEWSLPPPAPPDPRLDVVIERWEPPLPSEVVAAVEHIHTTVFGEAPGDTYGWLQTRPGATCFVARHEGAVVGFKLGAEKNPRQHHSHEGGVLPEVRRRGVARALMTAQHAWAESWGARALTTNTMNDFVPMLLLNLSVGFEVVGVEARGGRTKLRLTKRLT